MRRGGLVILLVTVVLLASTPAWGAVEGQPVLSLSAGDNRVTAGEVTTLGVTVTNAGNISVGSPGDPAAEQRVTTARGLVLEMRPGDAPLEVQTGRRAVGSLPEGSAGPVTFQISVDQDAEPGIYQVPVDLSYRYTSNISSDGEERIYEDETVRETKTVSVRVEERARFAVVDAVTDAAAGRSGTLALEVENVGSAPASDATVGVQSRDGALRFGDATAAETFVGRWNPGESRILEFDASVAPGTTSRPLAVQTTVSYEDDDGVPRESVHSTGVIPRPEQTFSLVNTSVDARVDADGTLSGTVVNEGPGDAENAVIELDPPANMNTGETEIALGHLGPNETADFEYDFEVRSAARAGQRQFTFHVRYHGDAGEEYRSDPLYAQGDIGPTRPVFTLEPVENQVERGRQGRLVLAVTNNGDEPLTDISAKLFSDDPISVDDSDAFIDRLAPGNTARVVFGVSVSGGMNKTYPVTVDFQYDDADGETLVSNTYRVPVQAVQPQDDGGPPWVLLGGGAVALVIAGWFAYTRYLG